MGYSPKDFYAECKDILQDDDLFGDLRWFVEKLLAVSIHLVQVIPNPHITIGERV